MSDESLEGLVERLCFDILLFAQLVGFHPWSDQREVLLAIQDAAINPQETPERVIVKAGTGVGKSALVALAALWLLFRAYGTKIIVTAPTDRQVRTVLMAEIRGHIFRGPAWFQEMFDVNLTSVKMKKNPDWQIIPITAAEATSVQGQHHRNLWIIAEEVSGISEDILEAFFRTLSQRGNGFIGIGNPNFREGMLFKAFTSHKHHWPRRFTMNKRRLAKERPDLVDPRGIAKMIAEYGEDHDQVRVGIDGEFPYSGGHTVLDYGKIVGAIETHPHIAIRNSSNPRRRQVGLDFARFGGDLNVRVGIVGNAVRVFWKGYCEPYDNVIEALSIPEDRHWKREDVVFIPDTVGVGQGMLVHFERLGHRFLPYGSHFNSPSPGFANMESAAWWYFRQLLETEPVHIPNDNDLIEQLSTRTYTYMPATNHIKVESKAEYKKRTGSRSPDEADALVQAFYDPEAMAGRARVVTASGLDLTSDDSLEAHRLVTSFKPRTAEELEILADRELHSNSNIKRGVEFDYWMI